MLQLLLTQCTQGTQRHDAMQINRSILASAALIGVILISGCKQETIVADGPADPDAATLNAAAPVELPPMVTQSRTYRCADGRLVYVDFFSNDTAGYKTAKDGAAVSLKAAEKGQPFTAEGYSVSGDGPQVSITAPGKGTSACKA